MLMMLPLPYTIHCIAFYDKHFYDPKCLLGLVLQVQVDHNLFKRLSHIIHVSHFSA